ncbi:multimerin-1 [Pelodytes ibericus]
MKLTFLMILLYVDGAKTRGDLDDVTEKPWPAAEELEIEEIVSGITDTMNSDSVSVNDVTITARKDEEESTRQYTTVASTVSSKMEELEVFGKILKAPTVPALPNRAGSTADSKLNVEQVGLTGNTNSRQKEDTKDGKTGIIQQSNRSPRQSYYNKGSVPSNQKPSFETTRGKNWCAYVHTRLMPTVAVDSVETYAEPCAWNTGGCSMRNRVISQPVYRMRHKIVTSLEWKCCPGYSGEKCQNTVQQVQREIHGSQAESNVAANVVDSSDKKSTTYDVALHQKLTDQIDNQDIKLTLLTRKVENISSSMSDMHRTLYSLEEKINDDYKGNEAQSFLKDLKSKTITELIQDVVKDQLSLFKVEVQETIAQLFKSMSGISVELERTKEVVKQLNDTMVSSNNKCITEEESKPTMDDIVDLKNRIEHLKRTAFICTSSFKDMEKKHTTLEEELEHERSRNSIFFDTINSTMSKMKEIHKELLSEEDADGQRPPALNNPADYNTTEYLLSLQDRIKKQNLMMLQLYDDINAQDSKINNFTITLELQRRSIEKACEDRFSSCKDDFQKQLKGTEENVHVLNKTVSDVVFPLDDKIDKMNEQISDLCYDMEILQPLIEKGAPFSMSAEYSQQIDTEDIKRQLKNLTDVVDFMSSRFHELMLGQAGLQSDAQSRELMFERRINECLMAVEDGLNNTMDIINNAVDSIHDNYMQKSDTTLVEPVLQTPNDTNKKLDSLFSAIPLFMQMNETLQSLVSKSKIKEDHEDIGEISKLLNDNFSNDVPSSFANLSEKLNTVISRLDECHVNITQMEKKLEVDETNTKNCESRLHRIESQVQTILTSPTAPSKARKDEGLSKDKVPQELYSRIKALEFKSILLSTSIPRLNKTAFEAKGLCQTVFITVKKVNESVPRLIKAFQPNVTGLQKGFEELMTSLIEVKMEAIRSNLTSYAATTMTDLTNNVAKLQKQMKVLMKKPAPPKKEAINVTTSTVGRNQRNTGIADNDDELSSCNSSPCYNGGTCINDRNTFVCACRHPFGGANCSLRMSDENAPSPDFSKGSYRYAPMVAFYASHTYGMTAPGPIKFNNLYVNYGSSYAPRSGKFHIPYLGVYVFKYTIESFSPRVSGYLVVDGVDKIAFQSENINSNMYSDRVVTGDALLELNYGQEVWLRLATGSIPAQYPPVTTFSGYLLYRT